MSVAFPDNLFPLQCLRGKRKAHKPFVWTLRKKNWSWENPFMLHHLVRIFSTPYTHIMSVHFPTDMKRRLITKHSTIKKTFLRHCILNLNAKVTSVDVVCLFQKLQQVKTVGLYVQYLSQHHPHSHTRHLQFTTRTAHRFLRTAKKRLSHSFHAFFWNTRPSCAFSSTKAPCCLKLLIPASNAIGRWGINVELSPEYPLNRKTDSWFTNCSTQNAFCSGVAIIALLHHRPREKRGMG